MWHIGWHKFESYTNIHNQKWKATNSSFFHDYGFSIEQMKFQFDFITKTFN